MSFKKITTYCVLFVLTVPFFSYGADVMVAPGQYSLSDLEAQRRYIQTIKEVESIVPKLNKRTVEGYTVNDKSEDNRKYANTLSNLANQTRTFVEGYYSSASITEVESLFNVSTDVFNIKEVRTTFDEVSKYAHWAALAAGLFVISKQKDFGDNGSANVTGGALSVTAAISLWQNYAKGDREKAIADTAIQIAVSRRAYDDTLLRLEHYKLQVESLKTTLNKLDYVISLLQGDPDLLNGNTPLSLVHIQTINKAVVALIEVGQELKMSASSILNLIDVMDSQARYYKKTAENISPPMLSDVVKGYSALLVKISGVKEIFKARALPHFSRLGDLNGELVKLEYK